MPPTLEELRFLRTLTPLYCNSDSEDSYDPLRSPTPENTTGVEFDPKDEMWRCTICGWEVETVDGVQGYCQEGHASDLTLVDGWYSTCEWDVGMWSDQGGEDGSYDGNDGRSEDQWYVFGDGPEGCRIVLGSELLGSDWEAESESEEEEDFGWIVEDGEGEEEVVEEGGYEGEDERMEDTGVSGEDTGIEN